jgi:iron complex transport system substrate-binding protein
MVRCRHRIAIFVAAALAVGGSGCRRESSAPRSSTVALSAAAKSDPAFPVRVKDSVGRLVVVPVSPRRILCLLPSFTETVFALGAGDRVVGVDNYSDYPAETARLPKLGGVYDTQLERALSLEPDLIFVSESNAALAPLSRSAAAVWAGEPRNLDDVYRIIELTGRLIGRGSAAVQLVAEMKQQIASEERRVNGLPLVRVYYELDPAPYSVGPSSFIGVLIGKAGGVNIVPADLGDFPKISPELVISSNPEVIIGASLDDVERRPGWHAISAVSHRRVFTWSGEEAHLLSRPGPRLPQGLRALARRLHP